MPLAYMLSRVTRSNGVMIRAVQMYDCPVLMGYLIHRVIPLSKAIW